MTSPPSQWFDRLLRLALTILAIALALYVAARLVVSVLPVLVGMAVVVLIGFAAAWFWHFRRSRW